MVSIHALEACNPGSNPGDSQCTCSKVVKCGRLKTFSFGFAVSNTAMYIFIRSKVRSNAPPLVRSLEFVGSNPTVCISYYINNILKVVVMKLVDVLVLKTSLREEVQVRVLSAT